MTGPPNYLTLHEIISTLLGPIGVEDVNREYSKQHHLLPGGTSYYDPTTGANIGGSRDFRLERLTDPASYAVGQINTHLRVFDLITDALCEGKISFYEDQDGQRVADYPLECKVDFNSFFSWFKSNPDQKTLLVALLGVLGRQFPEHWQEIIDSGKTSQTQKPKEKMWEEILTHAKDYFIDSTATKSAFQRDHKTKNILRKYKGTASSTTFERRLRDAGIKTTRGRPKTKK